MLFVTSLILISLIDITIVTDECCRCQPVIYVPQHSVVASRRGMRFQATKLFQFWWNKKGQQMTHIVKSLNHLMKKHSWILINHWLTIDLLPNFYVRVLSLFSLPIIISLHKMQHFNATKHDLLGRYNALPTNGLRNRLQMHCEFIILAQIDLHHLSKTPFLKHLALIPYFASHHSCLSDNLSAQ